MKRCTSYDFGSFLLGLELLWIFLYIGLCIYSFVVTTQFPFGGPMGENMRSDIFGLRVHILVFGTILGIQRTRPIWWAFPVLIFMLFSDVSLLVELCCFSGVRDAMNLWALAITVSTFQVFVTSLANLWFLYMIIKNKVKRVIKVDR